MGLIQARHGSLARLGTRSIKVGLGYATVVPELQAFGLTKKGQSDRSGPDIGDHLQSSFFVLPKPKTSRAAKAKRGELTQRCVIQAFALGGQVAD